jgi:amino acid transporter
MPGVYTQAVMGGQGLAGLTVSLSGLITTAGRPHSDLPICQEEYSNLQWSAFAYFVIACVVIVGCAISWAVFERLPIVIHYNEIAAAAVADRVSLNPSKSKLEESERLLPASETSTSAIFTKIKTPAFAVWLTFAVTLCVFPTGTIDSHPMITIIRSF